MRLSRWRRLVLRLRGRARLRYEKRSGWLAPMPIYLCRCRVHGMIYEDYPHGWGEETECPLCRDERRRRFEEALAVLEAVGRG